MQLARALSRWVMCILEIIKAEKLTDYWKGASCTTENDCSDDLVCKSGKCANP